MTDLYLPPLVTIHPMSREAMETPLTLWQSFSSGFVSQTPGLGVYFYPFTLNSPSLFRQAFMWNGASVAGNMDIGVYSEAGPRIVSTGPTAQVGTNVIQLIDIADTVLGPGRFFVAFTYTNSGARFMSLQPSVVSARMFGTLQSVGSVLPSTLPSSFANNNNFVAMVGLTTRSLI